MKCLNGTIIDSSHTCMSKRVTPQTLANWMQIPPMPVDGFKMLTLELKGEDMLRQRVERLIGRLAAAVLCDEVEHLPFDGFLRLVVILKALIIDLPNFIARHADERTKQAE